MGEGFFYADGADRRGPVDAATLRQLVADGRVARDASVWREGSDAPVPAHSVAGGAAPPPAAPHGVLGSIGAKLSALAGVPDIDDVPVQSMIMGSSVATAQPAAAEDVFAAGTSTTTPRLEDVPAGWPRPRVFWRVLLGAVIAYVLLRVGLSEFQNPRFLPGLIVVGAFGVPLSVVVFFFEMNTPRNVSIYEVAKMIAIGGATGLLATVCLGTIVPGTGVGAFVPALLTGAVEETGKALALLLVAGSLRFRWQLNGLLFGAAVGAGFAGFESASYASESRAVFSSIMWRAILAPGGHVIWTAMIGAAIWQVRGTRPFRLDMLTSPVVLRRWIVAVVLHGVWDALFFPQYELLVDAVLLFVGWYLVFGIFKLAYAEVAAAKAAAITAPGT